MSAPDSETQDQVRKAHQGNLKSREDWKMNVATKVTKVKMVVSRGLATQRPVKLVGILVLGALFMAGTAINLAPDSRHEVRDSASIGAVAKFWEVPDDEWRFDSPYYDDFRTSEENNSSYEQQRAADSVQDRLEAQAVLDSMWDYRQASRLSYDQRRAADSIQDRLEAQEVLEGMLQR